MRVRESLVEHKHTGTHIHSVMARPMIMLTNFSLPQLMMMACHRSESVCLSVYKCPIVDMKGNVLCFLVFVLVINVITIVKKRST